MHPKIIHSQQSNTCLPEVLETTMSISLLLDLSIKQTKPCIHLDQASRPLRPVKPASTISIQTNRMEPGFPVVRV